LRPQNEQFFSPKIIAFFSKIFEKVSKTWKKSTKQQNSNFTGNKSRAGQDGDSKQTFIDGKTKKPFYNTFSIKVIIKYFYLTKDEIKNVLNTFDINYDFLRS
jgi:hypothetical protein